jgi:hypothetical protein
MDHQDIMKAALILFGHVAPIRHKGANGDFGKREISTLFSDCFDVVSDYSTPKDRT